MWIVLLAVFVLGTLVMIGLPLFGTREPWAVPGQQERLDALLAEKARALRILKDLESERRAELMDDAGYEAARAEYIAEAVRLNREIADLTGTDPSRMQVEGQEP